MTKSIDELLELIKTKQPSKKKAKESHPDVMEFVKHLGVEPGTQAVPNYLIFYVYRCVWNVETNNKKKAKKITFFQTFGKHFPSYRIGKQRYYMLKEGLFDVNEEALKIARIYDKQHWQAKKLQKKISAPKQEGGEEST